MHLNVNKSVKIRSGMYLFKLSWWIRNYIYVQLGNFKMAYCTKQIYNHFFFFLWNVFVDGQTFWPSLHMLAKNPIKETHRV